MNNFENLKYIKIRDVKDPNRANFYDGGIDFFIPNDFDSITLMPNESILIPAGIKVDVPKGWILKFENKSGIAVKKNLLVGACIVDHGYKQEVHLNVINVGKNEQKLNPGDKLVQAVMYNVGQHVPVEVDINDMWIDVESNRMGGFGSTGN